MKRPPPSSTRTDTLFPYTALFRSLGEDHRLERRAGLPARAAGRGSHGQVHLVGVEVAPADHGLDLAVLVHGDHGRGRVAGLVEGAADRVPGRGLHVEVEGRVDAQATAVAGVLRSDERRVGKEWVSKCRSRWSPVP